MGRIYSVIRMKPRTQIRGVGLPDPAVPGDSEVTTNPGGEGFSYSSVGIHGVWAGLCGQTGRPEHGQGKNWCGVGREEWGMEGSGGGRREGDRIYA